MTASEANRALRMNGACFRFLVTVGLVVLLHRPGPALAVATAPPLGTAQSFAVLAGSAVTNTGPTTVHGSVGVSPGSAVTGFPPGIITGGTIHSANAVAVAAQNDVTTAYDDLAGQACDVDLTGQDLGGLTLTPGVYCFPATSAQLTGSLTLDGQGDASAVFVFQIGSTLTTASNASVLLINGASGCRTFWQVGSSATLGTTTAFQGNVLALASITLATGASVSGRALARTGAVTLDTSPIDSRACLLPEGTICSNGVDCESGLCNGGICGTCILDGDCAGGSCVEGACCVPSDPSASCGGDCPVQCPEGETCAIASDCLNGVCAITNLCSSCTSDGDCGGNPCIDGQCTLGDDQDSDSTDYYGNNFDPNVLIPFAECVPRGIDTLFTITDPKGSTPAASRLHINVWDANSQSQCDYCAPFTSGDVFPDRFCRIVDEVCSSIGRAALLQPDGSFRGYITVEGQSSAGTCGQVTADLDIDDAFYGTIYFTDLGNGRATGLPAATYDAAETRTYSQATHSIPGGVAGPQEDFQFLAQFPLFGAGPGAPQVMSFRFLHALAGDRSAAKTRIVIWSATTATAGGAPAGTGCYADAALTTPIPDSNCLTGSGSGEFVLCDEQENCSSAGLPPLSQEINVFLADDFVPGVFSTDGGYFNLEPGPSFPGDAAPFNDLHVIGISDQEGTVAGQPAIKAVFYAPRD